MRAASNARVLLQADSGARPARTRITCARTSFTFDPELTVGEEDRFADWSSTLARNIFPIGELDEGRFFLGIDETSEICLIETWVATFGPVREALDKLVLGIAPRRIA
ncbi:SUKH-3 domain-containing protein [Streptomyces misionensis]|uniref:SUKH-3 domain-containing protein n=1 Tax=Streptomyces misionensis TaxID=67331 RepID=UPI003410AC5B